MSLPQQAPLSCTCTWCLAHPCAALHTYRGGCRWLCSPAGEQTPPHVLHMAMLELFCACVPDWQAERDVLPPASDCLLSSSPLLSDCCEMKSRIRWMLSEKCPCEGAAFQEPFQGGAALMVSQHVPLQLFPALSLSSELGCRVCATLKGRCLGDWDTSPVVKGWLASS